MLPNIAYICRTKGLLQRKLAEWVEEFEEENGGASK